MFFFFDQLRRVGHGQDGGQHPPLRSPGGLGVLREQQRQQKGPRLRGGGGRVAGAAATAAAVDGHAAAGDGHVLLGTGSAAGAGHRGQTLDLQIRGMATHCAAAAAAENKKAIISLWYRVGKYICICMCVSERWWWVMTDGYQ